MTPVYTVTVEYYYGEYCLTLFRDGMLKWIFYSRELKTDVITSWLVLGVFEPVKETL